MHDEHDTVFAYGIRCWVSEGLRDGIQSHYLIDINSSNEEKKSIFIFKSKPQHDQSCGQPASRVHHAPLLFHTIGKKKQQLNDTKSALLQHTSI